MDRLKAYSVLGVHQNASEEEIKTAYKQLAQKYSGDNYQSGPLKDEAEYKMAEINEAFDILMSYIRAGQPQTADEPFSSGAAGRYPAIRQLINAGRVEEALHELGNVPHGHTDAEWNFLMGSAYYYKGWLDQAMRYFQEAVRLDPGNREYEAALRNLHGSAQGNMAGNPFPQQDQGTAAMNCMCNYCTMICCMDAMCGMCRGC